jgi:hypothetical protein
MNQNVTVVFEIFDSNGVVTFLQVAELKLEPNHRQEVSVVWVPEIEGTALVKSFALSTLYQPVLISTGTPLSLNVIQ